ncbi:MAG: hypothetical protein DRG69_01690 [Deltaproteobacteria bacterium]|nr:MAG: hypothetical protein DRG69_01690 [Deltaproteobacteria bacterium]
MSSSEKRLNSTGVRTVRLEGAHRKVSIEDFGTPLPPGASLQDLFSSLPRILAAKDLLEVARGIAEAARAGRRVLLGMGAHPIKVGLNPIVIDLMERGVLSGVAFNGACMVHDVEIALIGRTSEEVGEGLRDGTFGMASETATFINAALKRGYRLGKGAGEALGEAIWEEGLPHRDLSLFGAGHRLGVPLSVHIAIGTDVIHMHPSTDGAITGEMTHRDFLLFAAQVAELRGGVYINLGSAVILPEVFLKALNLARNLGHDVKDFLTVNMDFSVHYRPLRNVLERPAAEGGRGYSLVGHHEIMFPLLAAAVVEYLTKAK